MKTKLLIISGSIFLLIGFYLFAQNKLDNKHNKSNFKYSLNSKWNNTENIGRLNK